MQIQTTSVSFDPFSGDGPLRNSTYVTFGSAVTQAAAFLTGFIAEYSGGDDHHLGQLDIQVNVSRIQGSTVTVEVLYGLRDWSDNWDDRYDGQVFLAVVAE